MAYEIEAGFENICRKILESSRNALYINMRYLDVALSSLAWEITTDIPRIGTDGLKIAWDFPDRDLPDNGVRMQFLIRPCQCAECLW